MANSLLDVYNYSVKGDLADTDRIVKAGSYQGAAIANRDAVVNEASAALALTQMGNEASLDIANQKFSLDTAQIKGTQELGKSLAGIFEGSATNIKQENTAGLAAAQEAMAQRAELAKLSEEQNNTWNPVKKLALWWKRENLSDTVTNKMEEANAHFRSAAITADVTSMSMQAAVTHDTLNRGFEQQAAQQYLQADAKRREAELQALGNTLTTASQGREKIWNATLGIFQAQSWEEERKARSMQMSRMKKELASIDLQARTYLLLRGVANPTKIELDHATAAVQSLPEASRAAFNSAAFNYSKGARKQKDLVSGLSIVEVQSMGNIIPEYGAFAVDEMNARMQRRVQELDAESMKADKTFGNNPSIYLNSAQGKAAHKENLARAQQEVVALYSQAPASAIIEEIDTTAKLPASFNPLVAISADNGKVLDSVIKNPKQKQVALAALAQGGPVDNAYKALITQFRGSLNSDEDGPHVEAAALVKALQTTGFSSSDAASIVTNIYGSAASAYLPKMSGTVSLLHSMGMGEGLEPKIPVKFNGMPYSLNSKVDLMKLTRMMELKAKEQPFVSITKSNTLGQQILNLGSSDIPVITPAGKGVIQGTSAVNSWLTDKVVTPLQTGK